MIPASQADAVTHNAISRRAKHRTCQPCGAPILVGLDHDRCAGEARVDPLPLSALGEALALLADRSTYRLRTIGRLELDHRTRWHITAQPAGSAPFDVLAAHACGSTPLPSIPTANPQPSQKEAEHDRIPY